MKKHLTYLIIGLFTIVAFSLSSCKNGTRGEVEKLQQKVDSLQKVEETRKADYEEMTGFIAEISDGLDSIARHEDMLFTNKGREGTGIDKNQLKLNLEMFEEMLIKQKQRLQELSDSLNSKGSKISKLNNLVEYLSQQLEQKNKTIRELKADLGKKNVSIAQLRGKVSSLSESNAQLTEQAEQQLQALKAQDEIINECYVKIGTKKELKSGGYLTGGFLKKKKVDYENLDKSKFSSVDIRTFREVTVNSNSPKILTQMPESSYRWTKAGNGTSVLQITDPTTFWSVSNFLIIQL